MTQVGRLVRLLAWWIVGFVTLAVGVELAGCWPDPGPFGGTTVSGPIPGGNFQLHSLREPIEGSLVESGQAFIVVVVLRPQFPLGPSSAEVSSTDLAGSNLWTRRCTLYWAMMSPDPSREGFTMPTDERTLSYVMDGKSWTMMIADTQFNLQDGTLFLVAYDDAWQPTISQYRDLSSLPVPEETRASIQQSMARVGQRATKDRKP